MRLAYYIATHHKIEQFQWTWSAIYNDKDVFAVHVDRKSGRRFYEAVCQVIGNRANVHVIQQRVCAWSGWSCCLAELDGIRKLLSSGGDWQYLVNLSGQCYPIKAIDHIRDRLTRAWPQNFVRAWTFARITQIEPHDPHLRRPVVVEFGGKIRRLPFHWAKHPAVQWKGSTWHLLTRPFCNWIFQSGALKRVPPALKYTFCPDEILFQTLIMRSPFRKTATDNYGREVVWPGPKILTVDDWPRMSESSAFFARKFDCNKDKHILRRLAAANGFALPAAELSPLQPQH